MRFLDFLFPPREDERTLRDMREQEFLALMKPELVDETNPATVSLLLFSRQAVRAALHEAKYHGSTHAFTLLAAVLADYLRDADDVGRRTSHIALVPIPLSRGRLKERGFNQVEVVVRQAACELKIPVQTDLLVRIRETLSQVSLPRHLREKNMRGAFTVTRRADPSHTYVIIDDVLTTGATLQAAIDALREAGARHIIPLALAH